MNYKRKALIYVKNTGGGATKANFIEDWEPIGEILWRDLKGLVEEDEAGHIRLTSNGKEEVE